MDPGDAHPADARPPTLDDLLLLARSLNERGARYLVVGGLAINQHGLARGTVDIDLLVDSSLENQSKVRKSLEVLPDKAVREIENEDLNDYVVIRVGDEVVVDLMAAACGITYDEAIKDAQTFTIEGVPIPFVSAATLLRMKQTMRPKDQIDRMFLEKLLAKREKKSTESHRLGFPEPNFQVAENSNEVKSKSENLFRRIWRRLLGERK